MAAAERLGREGGGRVRVTLLEAKRMCGGRAGSFDDGDRREVDYCQHVAMGCCTNLLDLLRRSDLLRYWRRFEELSFHHPDHPPSRFRPAKWLPAPLHMAPTLPAIRYLSWRQRAAVTRAVAKLWFTPEDRLRDVTAGGWLRRHGQDAETVERFWAVILVSALGESVDAVSMASARKVVIDGFAAHRDAADVWVPGLPLSEMFGRRLVDAVRKLGVEVRTGTAVSAVGRDGDGTWRVAAGEEAVLGDRVVLATAWHRWGGLVDADTRRDLPWLENVDAVEGSPITGLHLWLDRPLLDRPHAVLVGTVAQWAFADPIEEPADGPPRAHDPAGGSEFYVQVVISASHRERRWDRERLADVVVAELNAEFAAGREPARLVRHRVVTDPRSVYSVTPKVESMRPEVEDPATPGLLFASDFARTGWPSTMEGAVIAGRQAAAAAMGSEQLTANR